jgi:hypothetical protein
MQIKQYFTRAGNKLKKREAQPRSEKNQVAKPAFKSQVPRWHLRGVVMCDLTNA